MDYKKAGVDIEAGYKSVELMKKHVKETMRPEVLGGLGGFAGAFDLSAIKNMEEPVLLSGTDGCGTKVKLAFVMDKHDTIGIDAVAMCVNDIACSGGEPLFFLDYIACGKNYPEKIATIVSGVAEGLFTMLIIVAVLFAIVGVAIGITYFVQKKNGVLNSYEAFSDIMTEDEFERWQKRKNKVK